MDKNIFALGESAAGDKFIGRNDYVSRLSDIIFNEDKCRRVTVTGLPRIGKTSIIENTLCDDKVKEYGYLFVRMDCDGISSDIDFWKTMIFILKNEILRDDELKENNMGVNTV